MRDELDDIADSKGHLGCGGILVALWAFFMIVAMAIAIAG